MAVAEVHHTTQSCDKTKDPTKPKDKKERPLTKIVVRRLPPSMTLNTFLEQVAPLPEHDYIYLAKGDMSLGENAFCRVYINFINASDIFIFKEKFDNYVFVDQKGHEYAAVVEFATFQKIPRKRKPRLDPKCGTVESDPSYVEFLESLKVQPNQEQKPEYSYQFNTDAKEDTMSTPLLEYVKQRRIDKLRIREERREQRKQRELERKKLREEEQKRRQKRLSTKPPTRPSKTLDTLPEQSADTTVAEEKEVIPEKVTTPSKEKKFSYTNTKPRFFSNAEKSDYYEKKAEFRKSGRKEEFTRDTEYRNRHFDDYKKETPRKTKKYSEKREERKNEVKKKTDDISDEKKDSLEVSKQDVESPSKDTISVFENQSSVEDDGKEKDEREYKENSKDDTRSQRKIRNKDRPTMAIYQPGMLSKRKVDVPEGENVSPTVKE